MLIAAHVVVYATRGEALHNLEWFSEKNANKIDLSHLCHNPDCINAEHLNFEPNEVNLASNLCQSVKHCKGHGKYPNCINL